MEPRGHRHCNRLKFQAQLVFDKAITPAELSSIALRYQLAKYCSLAGATYHASALSVKTQVLIS